MVEGPAKVVKYALFIANCVILVCGIVVFSVGVWTLASKSYMERLLGSEHYLSSATILIATGVVVTIISFLGCLGAIKETRCMLLTFFIILFMIFITMFVGGILSYVFRSEIENKMKQEMITSIPLYNRDSSVTYAWDSVQENMKCCGMVLDSSPGYEIWIRNLDFTGPIKVPKSCCKKRDTPSVEECEQSPDKGAFDKGCYHVLIDFVSGHALILEGIGIGISCVLIVGMMLSLALFLMIHHEKSAPLLGSHVPST